MIASNIVQRQISVNDKNLFFCHPHGDDTMFGTLSCLKNDKFHLSEVTFLPDDVLVDIGCNIGLLGLFVTLLSPKVRVYGFDASPLAIECFRAGTALNRMPNIQSFNVAVGADSKKGVSFFSNGKDLSCIVQEGLNSSNPVPNSVVNMISIDEIFDSVLLGIERVKYLKMDIEGGEFAIFDRLFEHRPDIFNRIEYLHLEIHDYKEFDPDTLRGKLMSKFGKKIFFDA